MRHSLCFSALVIGFSVFGCARERDAESPMVPASRLSGEAEDAIENLASARCDREQSCGRIGQTKTYSDREHCLNVIRNETREDFGDCRKGVDQEDLNECLSEINDADCEGGLDQLEKLAACEMDDLCLK